MRRVDVEKPKFKVGDIVVVTLYGTVGTITEVKKLNGLFLYKVNHNDVLYVESSLHFLSNYKSKHTEIEKLEVEYKYYMGDLVLVAGYGKEIFKVVGIRTEVWRYKEGAWEDIIYELSRLSDGEWLEAGEDELILIADSENAETFLQEYILKYRIKKEPTSLEMHEIMDTFRNSEKEQLRLKKERKEIIDGLLDVYNDYKILYELFSDQKYKDVMDLALKNLKKLTVGKSDG